MKILLDHSSPFFLAHGGVQVQIEETKTALERAGVEVEQVRWWDENQSGDLIHYFGTVPPGYLRLAQQKKLPVVLTSFFSSTCNRSDLHLKAQGLTTRGLLAFPAGGSVKAQLQWQAYQEAPHHIVGLQAEAQVLATVYGIPNSRITIVPLGLDEGWIKAPKAPRDGNYLITVGTICDVKRSIPLAEMARDAEVPVLFVGRPYLDDDPYWRRFRDLIDGNYVLHQPHVADRAAVIALVSAACGFVLVSRFENWSLAAHEAAAVGLPLLLPDMKWSRECFGNQASFFDPSAGSTVSALRDFYRDAGDLPRPAVAQPTWDEVALRLIDVYRKLIGAAPR